MVWAVATRILSCSESKFELLHLKIWVVATQNSSSSDSNISVNWIKKSLLYRTFYIAGFLVCSKFYPNLFLFDRSVFKSFFQFVFRCEFEFDPWDFVRRHVLNLFTARSLKTERKHTDTFEVDTVALLQYLGKYLHKCGAPRRYQSHLLLRYWKCAGQDRQVNTCQNILALDNTLESLGFERIYFCHRLKFLFHIHMLLIDVYHWHLEYNNI